MTFFFGAVGRHYKRRSKQKINRVCPLEPSPATHNSYRVHCNPGKNALPAGDGGNATAFLTFIAKKKMPADSCFTVLRVIKCRTEGPDMQSARNCKSCFNRLISSGCQGFGFAVTLFKTLSVPLQKKWRASLCQIKSCFEKVPLFGNAVTF